VPGVDFGWRMKKPRTCLGRERGFSGSLWGPMTGREAPSPPRRTAPSFIKVLAGVGFVGAPMSEHWSDGRSPACRTGVRHF
jgi:hypothetical protein